MCNTTKDKNDDARARYAISGTRVGRILPSILTYIVPTPCVECGCALTIANTEFMGIPLCRRCFAHITLLEPPYCKECGIPLISEQHICLRCREVAPIITNRSLFEYTGIIRNLVHHYKFGRRRAIARLFAYYLFERWHREWPTIPIVPVPSTPRNIKKRGWDQTRLLLQEMQRYGKVPHRLLLRRQSARAQKELSRVERLQNAQKLFFYKGAQKAPTQVVLLDDIYTTGATLQACASQLHSHGVQQIFGLTLAIDL